MFELGPHQHDQLFCTFMENIKNMLLRRVAHILEEKVMEKLTMAGTKDNQKYILSPAKMKKDKMIGWRKELAMNQLQKRNNIERKMTCHECSQIYTLLHTPKVASCNINEGSILKQQIIINLILLKLEENANAIHRNTKHDWDQNVKRRN